MLAVSCGDGNGKQHAADPAHASWDQVERSAQGTTVTLMMWQGDPLINAYISEHVVPAVKNELGITLRVIPGQGNEIVSMLMTEEEANASASGADLVWINGETFFQLRQINALYGPFVEKLPNAEYLAMDDPFIGTDFQQPVDGYECPWGTVQFALIYNSAKVPDPPLDMAQLEAWVKQHPGRFTIGNDFTGMTLLKSWLIHLAGGGEALKGPFNEQLYARHSAELWAYLERLRPFLWNTGKSYPASVAQMHQLFANGELWFTMSNNGSEVDNKVLQGLFTDDARAYVPSTGSIRNAHYMGIPARSANKGGAMAVANYLISPEAQWQKYQPAVWGDGTVLNMEALSPDWQARFAATPGVRHAPDPAQAREHALMEPAPEYMLRLFADFRSHMIDR